MDMENNNLDMKQLFFNNLHLLGFDSPAMEATHSIPFNKSMFELPNKRGAEIVLHFLFQRLNPTMCKEAFRDSWPIHDKKREQTFRKTCSNWLTNILQEEPESHLPRINASLFMSPGGEKFYQLLFYFSGYVLQKVMENELGVKAIERQKWPTLTSQNQSIQDAIHKSLVCSGIRHRNQYFDTVNLNVQASKTWKNTADEYVYEYRKLSKELRELEYKVRDEEHKAHMAATDRGSPSRKQRSTEHFDPEFDPRTIKRAQRMQQVRDMWKQLEDFDRSESAEREVVESIVERTINKHRIDGSNINVKVPDMLLRECHDEIIKRNVGNTYQGGKLNLVSLVQLWNLALQLYLHKLKQVGVPKFAEDVQKLTPQVHVQQNFSQMAQTLREQMAERIPEMKASVEQLREQLDTVHFRDVSPESIRSTVSRSGCTSTAAKSQCSVNAQKSFIHEHTKSDLSSVQVSNKTNERKIGGKGGKGVEKMEKGKTKSEPLTSHIQKVKGVSIGAAKHSYLMPTSSCKDNFSSGVQKSSTSKHGHSFECGSDCVCNKTAISYGLECTSDKAQRLESNLCADKIKMTEAILPSHNESQAGSNFSEARYIVSHEKLQAFEKALKADNLHPDTWTEGHKVDSSVTTNSSGYHSTRLSDDTVTSSSGLDIGASMEQLHRKNTVITRSSNQANINKAILCDGSVTDFNDRNIATTHTLSSADTQKEMNASYLNIFCGNYDQSVCFSPLKDMSMSIHQSNSQDVESKKRHLPKKKSFLPIMDMTVWDENDDHALSKLSMVNTSFGTCSTLKDMFYEDNEDLTSGSDEENLNKSAKYRELLESTDDGIINLVADEDAHDVDEGVLNKNPVKYFACRWDGTVVQSEIKALPCAETDSDQHFGSPKGPGKRVRFCIGHAKKW